MAIFNCYVSLPEGKHGSAFHNREAGPTIFGEAGPA